MIVSSYIFALSIKHSHLAKQLSYIQVLLALSALCHGSTTPSTTLRLALLVGCGGSLQTLEMNCQ